MDGRSKGFSPELAALPLDAFGTQSTSTSTHGTALETRASRVQRGASSASASATYAASYAVRLSRNDQTRDRNVAVPVVKGGQESRQDRERVGDDAAELP